MPPFLMGAPFPMCGGCPPGPELPLASLPSPILYLRADKGVTTTTGTVYDVFGGRTTQVVTTWADQSGAGDSGRNFTTPWNDKVALNSCKLEAAYNYKPTLGPWRQAFSGSQDCALRSGTWNTTYSTFSIFVIGHSADTGPNQIFAWQPLRVSTFVARADDSQYEFSIRDDGTGTLVTPGSLTITGQGDVGPGIRTSGTISSLWPGPISTNLGYSAPNLMGAEWNLGSSRGWANDLTTPDCTINATGAPWGFDGLDMFLGAYPLYLGSGNQTSQMGLYGVTRIAEVVAFDGVLTAPQRTALRDYFNTRYGMSIA